MKRAVVRGAIVLAVVLVALLVIRRLRDAIPSRGTGSASPLALPTGGDGPQPRAARTEGGALRVEKMPAVFADRSGRDRRIAGHVTFAGTPFAGATVRLTAWGGAIIAPDGERTTGADGAFDFGMRVAGPYEVVATAPAKLAAILRVSLADPRAKPAPDALELVLRACDTWVTGTVRDASGGPIARARVRREGLAGVETDDAGGYELCVTPGQVELEYSADGYGAVTIGVTADLRLRRDVVLVPEAVVQGVVVDEEHDPVADARVTVTTLQWGAERAATRGAQSGPDGRFQITQVLPGRVRLWAATDDMATEGTQEVVAMVGASPEVIVKLEQRTTISGKVMLHGKPVAGANLVAIRKSPSGRSFDTASQEDGTFVLTRVMPGELVLSSSQYRVVSPSVLHVDTKPLTGVVVELASMATVKGRVTRDGVPVAGIDVCCINRAEWQGTRTRADGTYEFKGVPPGNYELMANSVRAFSDPKKLTVVGTEDHVVDLDVVHGGEILGTVVDEKGTPLRGLFVKFQHPTTGDLCRVTTDEKGRYRCASLTGGAKYAGAVYATQAMAAPLAVPPGKPYPMVDVRDGRSRIENVTITVLQGQGQIRGRVVDTNGAPIADARVRANNEDRFSSWLSLASIATDVDGRFVLDDLADGSYFLHVRSTEGGTGTATAVVGGPPVTIVVALPGTITGSLAGFQGTPVIYVTPLGVYSQLTPGTVTGATYRVGGVEPGRYMINAQTTYEGDAREVVVRAGETTTVNLAAKGRGTIDVVITDFATKAPVPNIQCHAVMAVNGMRGVTNWDPALLPSTDAAGRLRLEPSPAGNIIVGCVSPDGRRSGPSAALTLAAGANGKVAMQSVRTSVDSWGTTGIGFDWRVVPPRIMTIEPRSGAADAGLAPGDLITAVDDKPVGTLDGAGVMFLIQDHVIGAKVPVTVVRGEQTLRVAVEMRPGA
ncbi:MAG: carboxypeptidase regulatory-like domain-containing protein [Kofleriaceae bacterium]|nr:carboxypeptidase regulatory-like domain-containing protein [Kofleriaceae bacterium]